MLLKIQKELVELSNKYLDTKKVYADHKSFSDQERVLVKLGFKNSRNYRELSKINKTITTVARVVECIDFLKNIREYFGNDVILVNTNDFRKVLKKYNLSCGLFEDYTGTIPEDQIEKIENAYKKVLNSDICTTINKKFDTHICEITDLDGAPKSLKRFPFCDERHIPWNGYEETINRMAYEKVVNIHKLSSSYTLNSVSRCLNIFIAAPTREIDNWIRLERLKTKDPFICSLTSYGVLIHTMWGKEAEDETIKKYKNFMRK